MIGWVYQCATNGWLETPLHMKLDLLLRLNVTLSLLVQLLFMLFARGAAASRAKQKGFKRTMTFFSWDVFHRPAWCLKTYEQPRGQSPRMWAHSGNRFLQRDTRTVLGSRVTRATARWLAVGSSFCCAVSRGSQTPRLSLQVMGWGKCDQGYAEMCKASNALRRLPLGICTHGNRGNGYSIWHGRWLERQSHQVGEV